MLFRVAIGELVRIRTLERGRNSDRVSAVESDRCFFF